MDEASGPSMASLRLIPVPGFPQLSVHLPPESQAEAAGKAPASVDRYCAPSQAPIGDNVNYDRFSYGQLRELCERRGYRNEDTEAVFKIRLEATDAAGKETMEGSSNGMDTLMTIFGKRSRNKEGAMEMESRVEGNVEKRASSAALDIALPDDLEVAKGHAQWWNPEREPRNGRTSIVGCRRCGCRSVYLGCR